MFIITNNPMVKSEVKDMEVRFIDDTYVGVLEECRNHIHNNYILLTHPLYGSVKPNETLYRSVVLEKGDALDMNSLKLIEEAINTAKKFLNDKPVENWPESIREDFMVVDLDIISNAISRII